ncbi:MAG: response regulator [Ramlibacter sp.]|nr:response regulator [Ramlibacter sp.]
MPELTLISVVDDDAPFRDSMRRLLKSHGYTVAVFPSAAEFLASTQVRATACLVADVQMPAMTGVELYRHLLQTGYAIPTILITAHPEDQGKEHILNMGVGCYLPKPVDEAVLIGCLRCAVSRGRGTLGCMP